VRGRGLTLAVAPVARVVAPHAGRVAFAAPFRSYGRIVILAHGGGWTTTITGLDRLAVRRGQWVTQGTTIGAAGPDAPHITTELRRGTRPVDVLALAQAG
jgi:septal ring factor EnvC (AmiA/AmiB activator)